MLYLYRQYDVLIQCYTCTDSMVFQLEVIPIPTVWCFNWLLYTCTDSMVFQLNVIYLYRRYGVLIQCYTCTDSMVFQFQVASLYQTQLHSRALTLFIVLMLQFICKLFFDWMTSSKYNNYSCLWIALLCIIHAPINKEVLNSF
jgi:hypothetical protein